MLMDMKDKDMTGDCLGGAGFVSRRGFLSGASSAGLMLAGCGTIAGSGQPHCGAVLHVRDLSGSFDWPRLAHESGLDVLATHFSPDDVVPFLKGSAGRRFADACAHYGIGVEHEMHAIEQLLPRELFDSQPELFRLDGEGRRQRSSNGCFTNPRTLEIVSENAVRIARACPSTTGRYFFWLSDFGPTCQCENCRELAPCEQAVLVENAMLRALRCEIGPTVTLSHLAYERLDGVPVRVKPEPGLFLEYAPIRRWRRDPDIYRREDLKEGGDHLEKLDALLRVFPTSTAQVLDYWLDESLACNYARPLVRLDWDPVRTHADVAAYVRRGVRNITSFAVTLADDYVKAFGNDSISIVNDYARIVRMAQG